MAQELKVMTFNIRFDNPHDGIHGWPYRRELVVETIMDERPDLLGTQECTAGQLLFLVEHLEGYRAILPPRPEDEDPMVQMPTIFYRVQSLRPISFGEFWLSRTPGVYKSKDWGAAFPRLFTYGKFSPLGSERPFWFANTHLDHVSSKARLEAARMIRKWISRKKLPVILVGDFNENPDGPVHRILTEGPRPLLDSWREKARFCEEREPSTIHHFTGVGKGGRIDWILVSPGILTLEVHLVKRREGLPSDHFPLVAKVLLPERGNLARKSP